MKRSQAKEETAHRDNGQKRTSEARGKRMKGKAKGRNKGRAQDQSLPPT